MYGANMVCLCRALAGPDIVIMMVGNKADIADEEPTELADQALQSKRTVTHLEASKFAQVCARVHVLSVSVEALVHREKGRTNSSSRVFWGRVLFYFIWRRLQSKKETSKGVGTRHESPFTSVL